MVVRPRRIQTQTVWQPRPLSQQGLPFAARTSRHRIWHSIPVSSSLPFQRHHSTRMRKAPMKTLYQSAIWDLHTSPWRYWDIGNCLRKTFPKYTPSPSVSWLQNWRMKQSMTVYSETGLFHWLHSEHWRQSLTYLSVMRSFLKQQSKEYATRMSWLRKVQR